MKKLLILSAIFLFGIFSVSAQNAWEVFVEWETTGDCQFEDEPGNGFKVAITVYDVANDMVVVNNDVMDVSETTFSYTFDVQSEAQYHCNLTGIEIPDFIVYAAVYMGNSGSLEPICMKKSTTPDFDCQDFSVGVPIPTLYFD